MQSAAALVFLVSATLCLARAPRQGWPMWQQNGGSSGQSTVSMANPNELRVELFDLGLPAYPDGGDYPPSVSPDGVWYISRYWQSATTAGWNLTAYDPVARTTIGQFEQTNFQPIIDRSGRVFVFNQTYNASNTDCDVPTGVTVLSRELEVEGTRLLHTGAQLLSAVLSDDDATLFVCLLVTAPDGSGYAYHIAAIDAVTRDDKWHAPAVASAGDEWIWWQQALTVGDDGSTVYLTYNGNAAVLAFDAADGSVVWNWTSPPPAASVVRGSRTSGNVRDPKLLRSSAATDVRARLRGRRAAAAGSAAQLGDNPNMGSQASAAVGCADSDAVYVPQMSGTYTDEFFLYALSARNGSVMWHSPAGNWSMVSVACDGDTTRYVSCLNEDDHLLWLWDAQGNVLGKLALDALSRVDGSVNTPFPALTGDGSAFLLGLSDSSALNVYAFNPANGTVLAELPLFADAAMLINMYGSVTTDGGLLFQGPPSVSGTSVYVWVH